ncbi:uncharacterized protein LOC111693212 [Trichogramma pretiosum]|uniref:uncharacterized protein LOC111693212 n=1 Tax=Trichogramma pretiosum TaxID=7493 RepID=UPI0006C9B015|nr:uncharacterized protein LOC111693212 [Trichogramma pretiosum]
MFPSRKKSEDKVDEITATRMQQLQSQLEFCQKEIDSFDRYVNQEVTTRPEENSAEFIRIQLRLRHAQYVLERILETHVRLSGLAGSSGSGGGGSSGSDEQRQQEEALKTSEALKATREQLMRAGRVAGNLLQPFAPDEV